MEPYGNVRSPKRGKWMNVTLLLRNQHKFQMSWASPIERANIIWSKWHNLNLIPTGKRQYNKALILPLCWFIETLCNRGLYNFYLSYVLLLHLCLRYTVTLTTCCLNRLRTVCTSTTYHRLGLHLLSAVTGLIRADPASDSNTLLLDPNIMRTIKFLTHTISDKCQLC